MKKQQATLTLHLLGKVQLRHGERWLDDDLAGKEQALLIYLACQPRQRFSREHLATLFWGEIPQSRSRYNLRRALWKLRSTLEESGISPDDCITTDGSWIRLAPGAPCWVDALEFENILKTHFQGSESRFTSTSQNVHQIRQTLDLYRGDFLESFSVLHAPDFEEWVTIERERLFLLRLRALTNLIQAFIGQGQHSEAITTCHRILTLDPLQEDIHRLLMRLYWETGQRAQAIRQYQTYQDLLQRELSIQPLEETQALYQRILQQKTPPTSSSSLVLTSRLTPPTPPPESFIRPRLINLLDQGLDTRLTLLSAPPGYGKTTLVSQWLHAHTHNGDSPDLHATWYKVSEVDNDPATFLEGLAASIARIHPDVRPTLQNEIRDVIALHSDTRQAVGHLLNALTSLETHPLVVILDDEERLTNPESLRVLQHIIDFLPANGHLYVLTRTDPSLPLPRLRIRGQLLEIRTPELRFTPEEAQAFLRQTTGANLPPSDIETIVHRAEGWAAPLWLAANAFKHFASNLNTVWEGVSAYLRDEVLAHQPPEVQTFLLQSAVLDRLTPDLCHAVLDLPNVVEDPRQAAQWLNEIEQRNLFIQRLPASGPNVFGSATDAEQTLQYTYHPLFRSFLRSELTRQLRAAEIEGLHRRAAQTLEESGELESALVHYQQAGDENEVARLLDQGLAQAPSVWLDQIDSTPPDQYPQITLSAGRRHQAEGRLDQARALYQQAVQGFESRQDRMGQGDSLLALAEISLLRGRYAQGLDLAREAMAQWEIDEAIDAVQRRTAALCTIGQLQACQGYLVEAQATLEQAQQIIVELSPPTLAFQVHRTQAWAAYVRGAYHRAMALNRIAEQEAGRDVPQEIVAAFRNPVPTILREWGEWDVIQQITRQRVIAARQSKDHLALIHAYVGLGNLHLDRGQYDEAEEIFQQAIDEAEACGEDGVYRLYALAHVAFLHLLRGDPYEIELGRYEGRDISPLENALAHLIAALPAIHEQLSGVDSPKPQIHQQIATVYHTFDQLGVSYGAFVSTALLGALCLAESAGESLSPHARRYISTALTLAAAEGYVQSLVVSADLSLPILRFGLREGIEPHFVARVLAQIGPQALPVILDLSRASDPSVRERAATALHTFGSLAQDRAHRETILAALDRLSQDDASDVRAVASQARQKIG
ncbi:MAG TPA: tetratricopeptide repeat protein [Chloroflexi bacterium]|nr:tetratricopeptide repeat protein [Chloroflexota bacterium]